MPQLKMEQARCANEAYRLGEPIISDEAYDAILRSLESQMTKECYEAFRATLTDVGGDVPLPVYCGSLRKCTHGTNDFNDFIERAKPEQLIAAAKLDGMGFVAWYIDGVLVRVTTIGDGETGEDITHNARHVVPNMLPIRGQIEVRGELCIPLEFLELTGYKNARNGVVGLMKRDEPDFNRLQYARALAYQILSSDDSRLHQLGELRQLGFETPPWKLFAVHEMTEYDLAQWLEHLREGGTEYLIDGLVICDIETVPENVELPLYTVAFKVNTEYVETEIIGMEIKTSKDGRLKGAALLKAVELCGTTVEHASIYNFKYVLDNKIGAGAKVIVTKAGEIIPEITEVLEPGYVDHSAHWELCPSCGSVTRIDGVDKRCTSLPSLCPAQRIKSVTHFLTNFDVLGAAETSLEKWGVSSIHDILNLVPTDRNAEKFLAEFEEKVFTASPQDLLSHQNWGGVGKSTWNKMFEKHGYEALVTAIILEKRLENAHGVGDAFWEKIDPIFVDRLNIAQSIESDSRYSYEEPTEDPFAKDNSEYFGGKSFCFTGKVSRPRKELEKMVTDHGGKIGSVSKNLDFLVVGEKAGSKLAKAKELGVTTLTEEEFMEMF